MSVIRDNSNTEEMGGTVRDLKEAELTETSKLVVDGADDPSVSSSNSYSVSFLQIYFLVFIFQLENNVVFSTMWHFVKEHLESSVIKYGAVLSVSAVMEVIGSIVLGYWSDRRPLRHPLMFAFFTYVVGNILYVVAWDSGYWVLVVSRGIAGFGFGGASMQLAYLTHRSSNSERTTKVTLYWLTALSTNTIGPLITLAILKLPFGDYATAFNNITFTALFNVILYSIAIVYVYAFWPLSASHHVSSTKAHMQVTGGWSIDAFLSLARSVPALAFKYIKLVFSLLVSVFQAIASPITDRDSSGNSIIFIIVGILILVGVVIARLINRKLSDYATLQIGQVTAFVSLFGLLRYPIDNEQLASGIFGISSIVLTLGNSIGITICTAAYSKAVGQFHPRKGVLMGWFITAAACGRIIGPILSCVGLETVGLNSVGAVLIAMAFISLVALSLCRLKMHYTQMHDGKKDP